MRDCEIWMTLDKIDDEDDLDGRLDRLGDLMMEVETKLNKLRKAPLIKKAKNIGAKKNHPLHFLVEKDLIEKLRSEAKKENISMGELCRQKLRDNSQLNRIEDKINKLSMH